MEKEGEGRESGRDMGKERAGKGKRSGDKVRCGTTLHMHTSPKSRTGRREAEEGEGYVGGQQGNGRSGTGWSREG